jgi:hypothetical protein
MGDPLGVSAVHAKPLTNLSEATRLFQIKIKRFGSSILIHGLTESGLDLIQKTVKNSLDTSSP